MIHPLVYFDGKIIPSQEARIPAFSDAVLYGQSAFTTVAVRNGKALLWDRHQERLKKTLSVLGIRYDVTLIEPLIDELIERNRSSNARLRVNIFSGEVGQLFEFDSKDSEGMLMLSMSETRDVPHSFRVSFCEDRFFAESKFGSFKTSNYLEQLSRFRSMRVLGFDEGIVLNEKNEVVSGCISNLFWTKGGSFFTPSLSTGCLPGTVRAEVIDLVDADEVNDSTEMLLEADRIFFTSSGYGIRPAYAIDRIGLSNQTVPPALRDLKELFD